MGKVEKLEISNKNHKNYKIGEMRFAYNATQHDPIMLQVKSPDLKDNNFIEVTIENVSEYAIEAMQEKIEQLPKMSFDEIYGAAVEMAIYMHMAGYDNDFNKKSDEGIVQQFKDTRLMLNQAICDNDKKVGLCLAELFRYTDYRFNKEASNYKLNA